MRAAADPPLRHGSSGARTRPRQRTGLSLWAAAWAAVACAAGLVLSGLVGLAEAGEATALLWLGVGCGAVGGVGVRRARPPQDPTSTATFVAVSSAWLTMIVISVAAYLATGTTGSLPDAIFESVAGFCTTNLSVLDGLESLPAGVLFWRALTQWLGGFAALALMSAVLPLHAPALVLPGDGGALPDRASAPPFGTQLRRLAIVYCTLGGLCTVAYAAAGMGAFDAFSYAFTTVSTGGFGNHDGGLAHFDSVAVDAVASVFMALAGVSAVTLWWAVRGRFRILRRSFELRVYLLVLAAAILVVTAWTWDGRGPEALRSGALAVTAAMSSTGFEAVAWSDWAWGAQMLIVTLIATGGMAGTAGGGFRMRRAIAVARYAYRELVTEIHPHTVHVVKIGRRSVGERSLAMLNGFQVLFALSVVAGVFALSLAGMDLWAGAGASISALATMGPAPGADLTALGGAEQGVLAVLMLLGRLAFFPLVVATGWALVGARRLLLPAEGPNGRRESP
ncbi:MAG: hypothetical protein OXG91_09185 [bacterium]|nr:hypothetical protein [bacterium]MCY3954247.1 hypothetical protein [bacterium]